jgi:hypothetical protein
VTGRLIGLGGKLRAGKDAVGDYLESEHDFVKLGMSDALNEALLKLDPLIPLGTITPDHQRYSVYLEAVGGYVEAKKNPEVRRLLQVLGTEVGREMIDPDVWVRIAEKKILQHWTEGRDVVITAVRFPNEVEMIRRLGGTSVWIERDEALRSPNAGTESSEGTGRPEETVSAREGAKNAIHAHASENSVSAEDFEYSILNNGTLKELYEKVDQIPVAHHYPEQIIAVSEDEVAVTTEDGTTTTYAGYDFRLGRDWNSTITITDPGGYTPGQSNTGWLG